MQNHTKIYLNHFGYGDQDFVPCEICGGRATETHHLINRGMGGVKNNRLDVIENLQAICRLCHNKFGDSPQHFDMLVECHAIKIKKDKEYLKNLLLQWD
jgi:hypothetical protein